MSSWQCRCTIWISTVTVSTVSQIYRRRFQLQFSEISRARLLQNRKHGGSLILLKVYIFNHSWIMINSRRRLIKSHLPHKIDYQLSFTQRELSSKSAVAHAWIPYWSGQFAGPNCSSPRFRTSAADCFSEVQFLAGTTNLARLRNAYLDKHRLRWNLLYYSSNKRLTSRQKRPVLCQLYPAGIYRERKPVQSSTEW